MLRVLLLSLCVAFIGASVARDPKEPRPTPHPTPYYRGFPYNYSPGNYYYSGYPYYGGGYPYYNYGGFPYYYHGFPYVAPYVQPLQAPAYQHLSYAGEFKGTCSGQLDGLYYVDDRSFAYCANGVKTVQSCAEGSANPSLDGFEKGDYKHILDFCSVNLVAQNRV